MLGIESAHPETGYGDTQTGPTDADCAPVQRFVEKPDEQTARRYLAEGDFVWNGGSFVMKASVWLDALRRFRPDILAGTGAAFAARRADADFIRPDAAPFNVVVGDAMVDGSRDSLVHATSRLVGVLGLENVIVVETPDAVLVAERGRSQDARSLDSRLNGEGRPETTVHRKVHRPLGWYDSIDAGPRFQVKRILVHPGASLSLQIHHHRAEHWIVVSGTAEITCGDKRMLLTENHSTYIPLGATHRLANPGKLPLEIIEVQSGAYLGEDDIVRFDNSYGRG